MTGIGREKARDWAIVTFHSLPGPVQREIRRRTHRFGNWEQGEAPRAPACPQGMTTGPPDFVGVGVPKAGTTWWFSLLMAHPDIHVQYDKELMYFNRGYFEMRRKSGPLPADLEAYQSWFPRPPGSKTGEWTPNYIYAYKLPAVLKTAAPDCKILILLRDPVERYRSDISRRTSRRRLRLVRYRGMARGFFSPALEPWEAQFSPSEILVLQFEACLRSPAEQLAKTFRFLGVDDAFLPPDVVTPVNKTTTKRVVDTDLEKLLVRLYEPDVVALAARYPQIDLRLWPNFSYLAADPVTDGAA
jgi:hypothetical protein